MLWPSTTSLQRGRSIRIPYTSDRLQTDSAVQVRSRATLKSSLIYTESVDREKRLLCLTPYEAFKARQSNVRSIQE